MKEHFNRKRLILLGFILLGMGNVYAGGSSSYNYSVTVTANPTGKGSVYAAKTKTATSGDATLTISNSSNQEEKAYLFATPSGGYFFLGWAEAATPANILSNAIPYEITMKNNTDKSTVTYSYIANFSRIVAKSNNNSYGAVTINSPMNQDGDNVILTATPSKGSTFEGWQKNGTLYSTELKLTLTVSGETAGEYTAVFNSSSSDFTGTGYYRVRSANAPTINDYISLVDNAFNYNEIVATGGGGTAIALNKPGARDKAITRAGQYLNQDITLISEPTYDSYTDPSAVFYFTKVDKKYDFQAQGTGLNTIATGTWNSSMGNFDINDIYANVNSNSDGTYAVSIDLALSSYNLGTRYLGDDNSTLTFQTENNSLAKWAIEPVDESHYFGVKPLNANIKDGHGYYWTTLMTAFPYEIPAGGGVKGAYTIKEITTADGNSYARPVLLAGQGETVAAGTPVLLKCSSLEAEDNKLTPTDAHKLGNPDKKISSNLLSGIYLPKKLKNDQANFRVLNISPTTGKIGFYKLAASQTYMSPNKAFLDLSQASAGAKAGTVYVDFDDAGIVDGISDNIANPEIPQDNVYYDLQGRRVEHPSHGIYIRNGKKVIVK